MPESYDTTKIAENFAMAVAGDGGAIRKRQVAPKCSQLFVETWEGERYRVVIEGAEKPKQRLRKQWPWPTDSKKPAR